MRTPACRCPWMRRSCPLGFRNQRSRSKLSWRNGSVSPPTKSPAEKLAIPPRHVVVKRGGEACELLLQARELGLPLRGGSVRIDQRRGDTLDLLQVLTDDLVFRLHLG